MLLWTSFSCASSLMQSKGRCCLIGGLNARYLRTSGLDQLEKVQVQAPILRLCTITTAHYYLLTRHFYAGKAEPGRSARTKSCAAWLLRTRANSGASTDSKFVTVITSARSYIRSL